MTLTPQDFVSKWKRVTTYGNPKVMVVALDIPGHITETMEQKALG